MSEEDTAALAGRVKSMVRNFQPHEVKKETGTSLMLPQKHLQFVGVKQDAVKLSGYDAARQKFGGTHGGQRKYSGTVVKTNFQHQHHFTRRKSGTDLVRPKLEATLCSPVFLQNTQSGNLNRTQGSSPSKTSHESNKKSSTFSSSSRQPPGKSLADRIAEFTTPTLPRDNGGLDARKDSKDDDPYSDLHIIPLRENKLLKNELFHSRRRSRSVGDLTKMLKIGNVRGLFHQAQEKAGFQSFDELENQRNSANKPAIAPKPQFLKKPSNLSPKSSSTRPPLSRSNATESPSTAATPSNVPSIPTKPSSIDGKNGSSPPKVTITVQSGNPAAKHQSGNTFDNARLQPCNTPPAGTKFQHSNTPPAVARLQHGNPPVAKAKSVDHIATLQSHENENDPNHIYDEVYQQAPQIKDLKKFFGATPTPANETVQASSGTAKGFFSKRTDVPLNSSYPPPPLSEKPLKKKKSSKRTANNDQTDDASPLYAVSPPLHPGSKVIVRKKQSSQTSSDRSGDSGIAPGIQMLPVPKNIIRKNGGSTKSEDSDFGSTASDVESEDCHSEYESDSDPQQAPEPTSFINASHKVAYEVLTSERTYVERLHLLDQLFQARIEKENERHHWFSKKVTEEIFSNLRVIYSFHRNFLLPDLENRLKGWEQNQSLGDIFKTLAPFLKIYSDYVSNFDKAVRLLNTWCHKQPKFESLLQEIQRRPECMNLTLQHHMLEPVQRIPRYELLLKEYLKKLPASSTDRKDADAALERIASAAHHSNDMMKSTDQFQKLVKLNEKIEGEDIIDHRSRQLLKEGKITKIAARGGNKPQEMYLFLFNDMMLCCVEKGRILLNRSVSYTVRHKLDVDGMMIRDADDCRFRVDSKQKSLELQATSEEEKEEWMKSIISAVHEMVRKKQTFINNDAMTDRPGSDEITEEESELGMRAPRWIKDDEVTMCMRCGTDFKALRRRRHHCRACGAVVCNKCSSYEAELPYDGNKINRVCYKCYYIFKGEAEGAKEQSRRAVIKARKKQEFNESRESLITEIDEENSYSSYLNVLQKREWVRFWVVATKQDLFALKAPKDVRPVLTLPIKLYKLCELNESDNIDRPFAFKLSDNSRSQHIFAADNRELMKRWQMVFTNGIESVLKTKYMTEEGNTIMECSEGSSATSHFQPHYKKYTVNGT